MKTFENDYFKIQIISNLTLKRYKNAEARKIKFTDDVKKLYAEFISRKSI